MSRTGGEQGTECLVRGDPPILPRDPCWTRELGASQALLLGCLVSKRAQEGMAWRTWTRARVAKGGSLAQQVLLGLLMSGVLAMRGPWRPRPAHLLLLSFMNVHMSRSSGLCAKEQFPTYWHLRPFCAWMQSCGGGKGSAC